MAGDRIRRVASSLLVAGTVTVGMSAAGRPAAAAERKAAPSHASCQEVVLALSGSGDCGIRTSTGVVTYTIDGMDLRYAITYTPPHSTKALTCAQGHRKLGAAIRGVCRVPRGSSVFPDISGSLAAVATLRS